MNDFISLISNSFGIIASVLAIGSWLWERTLRRRIEAEGKRRIWAEISKVRGLMADMEKDELDPSKGIGRQQAVGKLTFMLRDLLREACIAEKNISVDKILLWRKVGKIGSDWQEQIALNLLLTEEISEVEADKIASKFAHWDELPDDHTCTGLPPTWKKTLTSNEIESAKA